MKTQDRFLGNQLKLVTSFFVVLFLNFSTYAQNWQQAESLLKNQSACVVGVEAKISIDMGEMAAMMGMNEPSTSLTRFGSGVLVHGAGGIVVATSAISEPALPDLGGMASFDVKRTSLQVILADGKSYAAQIVGQDNQLGLSFLKIKGETKKSFPVVKFVEPGRGRIPAGQALMTVRRLKKRFNFAPRIGQIHVAAQIRQPFLYFLQQGAMREGNSVFDDQGHFVGYTSFATLGNQEESGILGMLSGATSLDQNEIVVHSAEAIYAALPSSWKESEVKIPLVKSRAFQSADQDGNGKIDSVEMKAYAKGRLRGQDEAFFQRLFKFADLDDNGFLTTEEFEKRMAAVQKARNTNSEEAEEAPSKDADPDLDHAEKDYDQVARRAAPRDAFPVFDNPKLSLAKNAATDPGEMIIGVVCDGEARAYPISIMGVHELGNDVCGQTPIAVSW